jgi:hypothetical protein
MRVYLPVQPRISLSSEQRAVGISVELYNLKQPKHLQEPGQLTTLMLPVVQHPDTGQWACIADTDLQIAVHPEKDVTALVALFPQLSTEERAQMTYYISTSPVVVFAYLMPSDAEVLTEAEAEAAGWFNGLEP